MLERSFLLRFGSALLIVAILSGCTTFGTSSSSAVVSVDAAQVPAIAAGVIAEDLVGRLAEVVGPGIGTITIKSDNSAFAAALDASLRKWGYAVAVEGKTEDAGAIQLTYVLDTFEGAVLARLSTPTVALARAYALDAVGAEPSSPLSVMLRS